jgi:hypothetical protein
VGVLESLSRLLKKGGDAPFGTPKSEAVEKRFPMKLDSRAVRSSAREAFFNSLLVDRPVMFADGSY